MNSNKTSNENLKDALPELTKKVIEIAREAGDYVVSNQKDMKKVENKGLQDYATNLDKESEELIVKALCELGVNYPVYGEEEHERPDSDVYWIVDPIDGTRNFFRGLPFWSVNIALYDSVQNQVLLAVVYFPITKDMFSAYKDGGAMQNGVKICASDISDPREAVVVAEMPNPVTGFFEKSRYEKMASKFFRVRSLGIGAELCYLANGGFEAFIDFSGTTQDYDILPGLLIAEEAGCKIVEFDYAKPIEERVIVVTNGRIEI